jgi:hypothetical protein
MSLERRYVYAPPVDSIAGLDVNPRAVWPIRAVLFMRLLQILCQRLENLCPSWVRTGMMVDDGYAEFVIAKSAYVARLPEQLDYVEAASLMCASLRVRLGRAS